MKSVIHIIGNTEMQFQINYKFVAPNAQLRTGAIVIDAKDPEAAKKAASEKLALTVPSHKITAIRPY